MNTNQPLDEQTAHYNQVLRDLVDMATDIARMVHAQAARQNQAATAALPPAQSAANDRFPDTTLAFDRIARTIRRTILVAQKLNEAPRENPAARRIASRKRILRHVEDLIQRNAEPEHLNALHGELRERLDSPDLEDDIDHRPLEDIVADICRDLRVAIPYAPNYKRRTPAEVETLRAQAAALPQSWSDKKPILQPQPATHPRMSPGRSKLYAVGYEERRNREGLF